MTPFFIALQFLTRLKIVNQTEWSVEDFGKSVVAFPYVGLIIGLILAILYGVLSPFIPIMPLMLIIVVAEFLITGGLHADGLMDTSDGLFSGRERERKLEIMKDSRIGSFGVVAFVFVTLLKALCLPNGILYKSASDPNYEKILEMAARMGVSWSAIRIRLQQMQVIKGKPIHCHPLDIMRFGE